MSTSATPGSEPVAAPDPDSPTTVPPAGNGHAAAARWILVAVIVVVIAAIGLATALRPSSTNTAEINSRLGTADSASAGRVRTTGRFEITARLVELPGKFLANDGLYNYAFVLKYHVLQVHRSEGQVESTVYVAHYNPRKTRARVADEFYPDLGGDLERFRAGDSHRLALELPWDEHYIGPLVDRYHKVNGKRIYWAIWSNAAGRSK